MGLIYTPKGPALEYSPWACNLYKGCGHRCVYCYAPHFTYQGTQHNFRRQLFDTPTVRGKAGVSEARRVKILLRQLENAAKKWSGTGRVLMSFTSDPYQELEETLLLTQRALKILGDNRVPTTVLTKNKRAMRDIDLFVKYDVEFATTICFTDETMRQNMELHASTIQERFDTLAAMRAKGLSTWVSLEPVVDPAEALKVIDALIGKTDKIKVGTVDKRWDKKLHENIDWAQFTKDALKKLHGKQTYYIKDGLWKYADDEIKQTWPKEG
jgi:DNA repair photolyase